MNKVWEFDEPAECLNCGLKLEASDLKRVYSQFDMDYHLFCPRCESNDIKLYRPNE